MAPTRDWSRRWRGSTPIWTKFLGGRSMQSAMPFLWFDNNAEAAIDFYASLFPGAKVISKRRNRDGALFTATLELGGVRYGVLNGGPHYKLTPAFSIMVQCDDQAEVDRLWSALTADGGEESRCGWLVDRFGLSWQIIPKRMSELMESEDAAAANRVTQAMLKMGKIDLATLERAYTS